MNAEIFQIFYASAQRSQLDRAFTAYDNSKSEEAHLFEFGVLRNHYLKQKHKNRLSGFVSWKFEMKSGISGQEFKSWIDGNPGYDLYFINPFPLEVRFRSVWRQGEAFHPGIIKLADKVITLAHPHVDIVGMTNYPKEFSFCNYWVGNEKFWEAYMNFSLPIFDVLMNGLNPEEKTLLWAAADRKTKSPLFPFITERFLSTMLAHDPAFKWTSYSPKLNPLLKKTTRSRAIETWIKYKLNLKTRSCALAKYQTSTDSSFQGGR